MTLQQRIKASAQELIRLLEESDNEYQDFLKDRDARLGVDDPMEPDGHPMLINVLFDNGKPFTRSIRSEQPSVHQAFSSADPAPCGECRSSALSSGDLYRVQSLGQRLRASQKRIRREETRLRRIFRDLVELKSQK